MRDFLKVELSQVEHIQSFYLYKTTKQQSKFFNFSAKSNDTFSYFNQKQIFEIRLFWQFANGVAIEYCT